MAEQLFVELQGCVDRHRVRIFDLEFDAFVRRPDEEALTTTRLHRPDHPASKLRSQSEALATMPAPRHRCLYPVR